MSINPESDFPLTPQQQAFLNDFGRHFNSLLAILISRGFERVGDDAAQKAMLKTWTYLGRHPDRVINTMDAWLAHVGTNEALKLIHRENRYEELGEFDHPAADPFSRWNSDSVRPGLLDAVLEVLCELPCDLYEAFICRAWDGLSMRAIAEKFGTTIAKVRMILIQAKQMLCASFISTDFL